MHIKRTQWRNAYITERVMPNSLFFSKPTKHGNETLYIIRRKNSLLSFGITLGITHEDL